MGVLATACMRCAANECGPVSFPQDEGAQVLGQGALVLSVGHLVNLEADPLCRACFRRNQRR